MTSTAKRGVTAALSRRDVQLRRLPSALIAEPGLELKPTLSLLASEVMFGQGPELFVVQIGAFDGVSNDPVHDLIVRHGWHGVVVEPQQRYFELLCSTYADRDGISPVNAAISDADGTRPLYWIEPDPSDLMSTIAQFASFDHDHLRRNAELLPDRAERIRSSDVQCLTFETLLQDVANVDVLQIDTEGFDATVLSLFDLGRWQPQIVQFEHLHLERGEFADALALLGSQGYRIWCDREDTLAYRPRPVTRTPS